MKIRAGARLGNDARQLAQRLRHEAGLQADVAVAHLAVEFGLGHERRDRVHHQHVDGTRAHQRFGDLQRLLAVVGLRNQQVVHIDAELPGIDRIQRMLGVHEGGQAAGLCASAMTCRRDRRLAGGLRAEDLDHAAAGNAADAQCRVESRSSRWR